DTPLTSPLSPASSTGGMSRSTTGKSGRVIEKLQAENDRLKRELKVEITAKEEARRASEPIKSQRDVLQSTNNNLVHQTNIDKTSLVRKERKIEELKAERDAERAARVKAEANMREHADETERSVREMREKLEAALLERDRANHAYEVLQGSWKRLDEGYRTSVEGLRRKVEALETARERVRGVLGRLEVRSEPTRHGV